MTTHDDDQIARWLSVGPDAGPTAALDATLAHVPEIRQRPGWLVDLLGGTIDSRPVDRRARFSLGVAVGVLVVVAGAIFVAGSIDPVPEPSPTTDPSPPPSPALTSDSTPPPAVPEDVIVFKEYREVEAGKEGCEARFHCFWSWVAVANADGTDQHRVFPDAPPYQSVVDVSADGRKVIVRLHDGVSSRSMYSLTDLAGTEPVVLDTRCERPCLEDWISTFAFSPDGTRLAFVRSLGEGPALGDASATVIAVMNLQSGAVTELESTLVSHPDLGAPCGYACGPGSNQAPSWSPDGLHITFSRSGIGTPNQPRTILDTALFVVDADGSNLHQLVPLELGGRDAQWSRDGTLIAFTSGIESLTIDDFGKLENWHQSNDIYTVRPDGTDVRRLTTFTADIVLDAPGDVGATLPMWTLDGRIITSRRLEQIDNPPPWEIWAMDADGANLALVEPADAAALTDLGCIVCPYPFPDAYDYPRLAFWRTKP